MFISPGVDNLRQFYQAYVGESSTPEQMLDYGWQILEDEREFNRRAGLTQADDALPDCMRTDAIGANGDLVFDVKAEIIAQAKQQRVESADLFEGTASA